MKTENDTAIRKQKSDSREKAEGWDPYYDLSASCQPRRDFRRSCDKLTS